MKRRIVIAPDSFKGSVPARRAADALARGWGRARPDDEVIVRPMADGGEGTLDAFLAAIPGATLRPMRATGADGERHDSAWVLVPPEGSWGGTTAVIELASTSGIEALQGRLRPWDADTTGVGEAIVDALRAGVSRIMVGLGSSASTDGGAGILRALGARILDADGEPIAPGLRGLRDVTSVDLSGLASLPSGGVMVLADVDTPLCGPRGAAAVFGPQKGLRVHEIAGADAALAAWAAKMGTPPDVPGAGAAGGAGFAMHVWGAKIVSGARYVAELIGLPRLLTPDTIVVTGEGAYDRATAAGKVPEVVARLAQVAGARAALVVGRIDPAADTGFFAEAVSLTEIAGDSASAMAEPERYLEAAGALLASRLA
ncbi:glycerate kinase [Microbacterium schleiferi]|nr:glycerate kinase [Microbacterium schleiferi]MCC4267952.1 glycerate kinase [Microbacterium schleiferi]